MNQLTSEVKVNTGKKHVFQLESGFVLFLFEMNYLEHWKLLISELSGPILSIQNIYCELQTHFFKLQ